MRHWLTYILIAPIIWLCDWDARRWLREDGDA